MITTDGKLHIKRYLAGYVPAIARTIAFGIGGKAEAVGDTTLQFEIARSNIALTSFDFDANKLIFKGTLDETYSGTIYEVAIFSSEDAGSIPGGSRLVTTFDSDTEEWLQGSSAATFNTTGTRIGDDSVSLTPAANGSVTVSQSNMQMDFSENSGADNFVFAFNSGNANLSSVRYRFLTDASNYYDFTVDSGISTGYNVISRTKASATVTGSPNWGNITQLQVTANAGAGGAVALNLDGIRIEDADTISPDYVMVSRELLSTPFVKEAGRIQEVEFALDVSV